MILVSLVLAPPGVDLPYDDLSVQEARRAVLARRPFDLVTTFVREGRYFDGALTVARTCEQRARIRDDPFARLFPPRLLVAPDGLWPSLPPPAGPVIERYGRPWPQSGFRA